jgi:hypothetical protein
MRPSGITSLSVIQKIFMILLGESPETWIADLQPSEEEVTSVTAEITYNALKLSSTISYRYALDETGTFCYVHQLYCGLAEVVKTYRVIGSVVVSETEKRGAGFLTDCCILTGPPQDPPSSPPPPSASTPEPPETPAQTTPEPPDIKVEGGEGTKIIICRATRDLEALAVIEVKKKIGRVQVPDANHVVEGLLQAYYTLNGFSQFRAGNRIILGLCDMHNFNYFRFRMDEEKMVLEKFWFVSHHRLPPRRDEYYHHLGLLHQILQM